MILKPPTLVLNNVHLKINVDLLVLSISMYLDLISGVHLTLSHSKKNSFLFRVKLQSLNSQNITQLREMFV